ncbi:MAG TPA: MFS transporter [Cycloclasticus sp.]|nr:MFS transporter [Cycloclasticus sp.]
MTSKALEMGDIIEKNPLGAFQKWVMFFCALVIVFDGFDVLAIAFAAPALSAALEIPKSELGYIFSAGLVGMMIGALVLGPVGDKYGRRYAVIGSVLVFGLCTLLTGFIDTYNELLILRFVTGLGLGGAMPNATALMTEYVSNRHRNVAIAVIFLGMPIGGITGGLLAGQIIPVFGWSSLFYVGGLMPLLLLPVLLIWLPESPRFLLEHDNDNDAVLRNIARKIDQENTITDDTVFAHHIDEAKHFPIKALFLEGRAKDTLLLWTVFFFNLMVIYFLYSWIPTLLVQAGYELSQATKTVVVLNIGGAVAPFMFSKLIKSMGSKVVLTSCFFFGALSMIAVGQLGSSLNLVMILAFFAGFFIVGGQISLNALSSYMYPTHIRSTGVGWANGIGRSGSIFGPLLAGALVTASFGLNVNFIVFGALCFITATASFFISNHEKKSESI